MSSPELFSQTQQKAPREQHIEQHEWSNVSAQPRCNELPPEALQGNDLQLQPHHHVRTTAAPQRGRSRKAVGFRPANHGAESSSVRPSVRARYFLFHTRLYLLRHGSPTSTAGFRCHLKFTPRSCCATLAAHSPPLTKTNARTEGRGEGRPAGAPAGHGDRVA